MKSNYSESPLPDKPSVFKTQYYYREDIGLIKVTNPNQAQSARSIILGDKLFNSEHECLINYYKNRIDGANIEIASARAALEQATIKLNKLHEEFSYLKTDHPELFL